MYVRMFHPHRGGIERVTDILAREFLKRGYNIFYMHNIKDESLLSYSYPAPMFFFPGPIQDVATNGAYYQEFLINNKIDIVINQDPLAYHALCKYSAEIPSVRVISVIHGNPSYIYKHIFALTMRLRNNIYEERIKRALRILKVPRLKHEYIEKLRLCYADSFKYTDMLCLLSWRFISELKEISDIEARKVNAIPNPNTYLPEGITIPKKKQILYVGRLEWYQKRVDRLMYIWKHVYRKFIDWELVIVGDGPFRKTLEQGFSSMERIRFVGYQDPKQYYQEASILCLTSDFEGWGMVLTEAMTFGTVPILYNSYAAAKDIVENGENGILVPPFSRKRYVKSLEDLMQDENKREKMSYNAIESVKRFDVKEVANQWEAAFRKLKPED